MLFWYLRHTNSLTEIGSFIVHLVCLIGVLAITFITDLIYTNRGVTCSESGFLDLSSEQECVDAVKYAKYFNEYAKYKKSWYRLDYPIGCFIYSDLKTPGEYGHMGFNQAQGERNTNVISICKKGDS